MNQLLQRISLLFCLCFLLLSCSQPNTHAPVESAPKDSAAKQTTVPKPVLAAVTNNEDTNNLPDFKTFKKYQLTDTIVNDVNGDGVADKAFFASTNGHRYMKVEDGSSHTIVAIGKDVSFKDIGDQFDWIDLWGITEDKSTYETVFTNGEVSGSKKVKLSGPSIVMYKSEVGGGVIAYLHGRYQWIHQGD